MIIFYSPRTSILVSNLYFLISLHYSSYLSLHAFTSLISSLILRFSPLFIVFLSPFLYFPFIILQFFHYKPLITALLSLCTSFSIILCLFLHFSPLFTTISFIFTVNHHFISLILSLFYLSVPHFLLFYLFSSISLYYSPLSSLFSP